MKTKEGVLRVKIVLEKEFIYHFPEETTNEEIQDILQEESKAYALEHHPNFHEVQVLNETEVDLFEFPVESSCLEISVRPLGTSKKEETVLFQTDKKILNED